MKFPKQFSVLYGSQYLQGKYCLFTDNGLITSKDGKTWSGFTLKKQLFKNIVYNGKVYIGQRGTRYETPYEDALYTSKDFKSWTPVTIKIGGEKNYLYAKSIVWTGKQFVTIGGGYSVDGAPHGYSVVATSSDGTK